MTTTPEQREALRTIPQDIPDPRTGLPDDVFEFVLKVTPMINVDLLVRDDRGRHLLAWREDPWGSGWHIPGGIIRFDEPIATRIAETARTEMGATVLAEAHPATIREFHGPRGHFISLLYRCELTSPLSGEAAFHAGGEPAAGDLAWISGAPENLYFVHQAYAELLRS